MHTRSLLAKTVAAASAALVLVVSSASAQAWHYPTLQTPEISTRDFTFLVAGGGDYGTSAVAQWREGFSSDFMANFDVGVATPTDNTMFLAGAGLGYSLMRATQQTPIDLMVTGGLYGAFGSQSFVRIPVGVVAGHRFPLAGGLAITPFVSPRLSIDVCASDCGSEINGDNLGTNLKLDFDLGASLDVTSSIGIRAALTIGGVSDGPSQTAFGIGLTYRPNMGPRR
jgi:opacity protein-like surface antigen